MKNKKQFLALLLALMMVISTNPALVFSEDINSQPDPPAAAEDAAAAESSAELGTDIAVNGKLVDNDKRRAGDLLVITDENGNIAGYGVNYDKDTFVRFSKKSGEVRIFETKTLKDNYKAVRIV